MSDAVFHLTLRRQEQDETESGAWAEQETTMDFPASGTAVLLCDVWDDHWCKNAARRCDELARKMAIVVDAARARGAQIIHAPSDCMKFYEGTPQRRRMQELPQFTPPQIALPEEPPLPIDDSDGGCDDAEPDEVVWKWTRQHPAISIEEPDGISDSGDEVYNLLRHKAIGRLLIMGVHTNFCVLKRSFGIRAMLRRGVRVCLVRDLTDALYNPKMPPYVSHDEGTELVIRHIERYLCPTILSDDLFR